MHTSGADVWIVAMSTGALPWAEEIKAACEGIGVGAVVSEALGSLRGSFHAGERAGAHWVVIVSEGDAIAYTLSARALDTEHGPWSSSTLEQLLTQVSAGRS